MTTDEDMAMRLPDGSLDPNHPQVADFVTGNAQTFREKSAAHEAAMTRRDPLLAALGAKATPEAVALIHDTPPQNN
jgi:hypothetical protein